MLGARIGSIHIGVGYMHFTANMGCNCWCLEGKENTDFLNISTGYL